VTGDLTVRTTELSPEAALLLATARTQVDAASEGRIRALLQQPVNWPILLKAAAWHGAQPLLYRNLPTDMPDAVPAAVLGELKTTQRRNALSSLELTRELLRVVGAFGSRDVRILPLKGPALAEMAYGDLALRRFIDLDLMVARRDLTAAYEILAALGYAMIDECQRHRSAYLHTHHHYAFRHRQNRVEIELHWRLVTRQHTCGLTFGRLWQNSQVLPLAGQPMRQPSVEDTLLLVCLHGSMHGWRELKQVCDVAELLRRQTEIPWPALVQRARSLGLLRMLLLGLTLARDLLDAAVPSQLLDAISADPDVAWLASYVTPDLLSLRAAPEPAFESRSFFRYHARLRERRRDRLDESLRRIFVPVKEEWAAAGIPEQLWPLQYVMRPARLARRYVGSQTARDKS
jgi:hypothetical protein